MTRSYANAPVHSELFAYSTLKTMGTGDATDAAGTSSTVRRTSLFQPGPVLLGWTISHYCAVGHELDHFRFADQPETSARKKTPPPLARYPAD